MTAAWKQKKFERIAQKDVVEELKNQVRLLQDKLHDHKLKDQYNERRIAELYQQRDEAMVLVNRYNRLRTEEMMIATPDGFKLVTGEELDIHCGTIEAKTWWGAAGQPAIYTTSADAVDSWSYTQGQAFNKALQASMVYGTSIVKMGIENVFNTGSESKETDQEDS